MAHNLHIRDTNDTGAALGFAPAGTNADRPLPGDTGFGHLINGWLPLASALNTINRTLGHADLHPSRAASPPPHRPKSSACWLALKAGNLEDR